VGVVLGAGLGLRQSEATGLTVDRDAIGRVFRITAADATDGAEVGVRGDFSLSSGGRVSEYRYV
jgi:hypothetical protein